MADAVDVIVIGGGVVGLAVARRLAIEGRRVRLFERGACGGEASWAGAGIISPLSPHRSDALARLQLRSVNQYSDFCAALREESGIDTEYERCGELQLAFDEQEANILRADDRLAREQSLVDPDGKQAYLFHEANRLADVEPAAASELIGGLECRLAGQVRNPRLLRALHSACERAGVDIHEGSEVTGLSVQGSRVTGVTTQHDRVAAEWIVLCAGAWSSRLDERLSRMMPLFPVRGQMILLRFEHRPFQRILSHGLHYLVPRHDGLVLLGATHEPDAGFVKRTTAAGLESLTQAGLRLAPLIAEAAVEASWSGLRPGTPDDRPYIGPVPGFEGLVAATGHYRNGLTLAPVTADAIAALLAGKPYDIDLTMCRPGRECASRVSETS